MVSSNVITILQACRQCNNSHSQTPIVNGYKQFIYIISIVNVNKRNEKQIKSATVYLGNRSQPDKDKLCRAGQESGGPFGMCMVYIQIRTGCSRCVASVLQRASARHSAARFHVTECSGVQQLGIWLPCEFESLRVCRARPRREFQVEESMAVGWRRRERRAD